MSPWCADGEVPDSSRDLSGRTGQTLGRTLCPISQVEHGTLGMPAKLWKITDGVCRADGALITELITD